MTAHHAPLDIAPDAVPKTNDRMKWFAAYAASGGLAIALTWLMVNSMLQETRDSQVFLRTQFIDELKETTKSNANAAKAMEDAARAMETQARSQNENTDALKELTDTQDKLVEKIGGLINQEETRRKEDRANAPNR